MHVHTSGNMFYKSVNPSFRNYRGQAITQALQTDTIYMGLNWSMGKSAVNGNGKITLCLYIAFL